MSKRLITLLSCVILGPLLGFLLITLWFAGGNTFWKQIEYFPYPVAKILTLQPYGNEFWVTTTDNATYHILYPCEGTEACWQQDDAVPDVVPSDEYVVSDNKCANASFVYPLSRKVKTCVTSTIFAKTTQGARENSIPNPWRVSLALTEDNQLWIWQKPWNFPNRVIAYKVFFTFIGLAIGLAIDTVVGRKFE